MPVPHSIEHEQIDSGIAYDLTHLASIAGCGDLKPVLPKKLSDQMPDFPVIVDNENMGFALANPRYSGRSEESDTPNNPLNRAVPEWHLKT